MYKICIKKRTVVKPRIQKGCCIPVRLDKIYTIENGKKQESC